MTKIVCIRHSHYDGASAPVLSCKACCGIYIDFIKQSQAKSKMDPDAWLEAKKKSKDDRAKAGSDRII